MSRRRRSFVQEDATLSLRARPLSDFCRRLLIALGTPEAHGRIVSDSLVEANLRGVDSHGIQMLVTYITQLRAGGINVGTAGKVARKSGACLLYDGRNGLGQVVADRCTDHVLRLVQRSGAAVVVARNSNHFGAGAYWGERIARSGCIGIVLSNACPAVAPWGGNSAKLGTNPICVAAPGTASGRWLLDMATTTVALGKVGHAAYLGQPKIPAEWGFLDRKGRPTTGTTEAQRGQPTPIGGYKGTGLAMMAEVLCAVLSGGFMATQLPVFRTGGDPLGISHFFLALDPRRFLPTGEFERRMGGLANIIKSAKPAKGFKEVLIAGEPEWRAKRKRSREGIPIPKKLWEQLTKIADELSVRPPNTVQRRPSTSASARLPAEDAAEDGRTSRSQS